MGLPYLLSEPHALCYYFVLLSTGMHTKIWLVKLGCISEGAIYVYKRLLQIQNINMSGYSQAHKTELSPLPEPVCPNTHTHFE